jgi:hypothetical protein
VLLVLGAIGTGLGIYTLVTRFQHGAFSCLPSDFPNYPGASVVNEHTTVAGGTRQCTMVLESNDNVDAVVSFYARSLSTGDWNIVSSEISNGPITFERKTRPQTTGSVSVATQGQHTEIDIQLEG